MKIQRLAFALFLTAMVALPAPSHAEPMTRERAVADALRQNPQNRGDARAPRGG